MFGWFSNAGLFWNHANHKLHASVTKLYLFTCVSKWINVLRLVLFVASAFTDRSLLSSSSWYLSSRNHKLAGEHFILQRNFFAASVACFFLRVLFLGEEIYLSSYIKNNKAALFWNKGCSYQILLKEVHPLFKLSNWILRIEMSCSFPQNKSAI